MGQSAEPSESRESSTSSEPSESRGSSASSESSESAEPCERGVYNQVRGEIVATAQRRLTRPVRRHAPLAPLAAAYRLRRRLRPSKHTDADPFALVEVDPTRIRRSVLETAPRIPQRGRAVGGDWDLDWNPFDERAVPRGIVQRYREGREWRETALLDAFHDQLSRFGAAWRYTDEADFERRCREIDRLYTSIRDDGYRRQERLHTPEAPYATTARLDEITVDVGRGGRLYWRGYGQHRLAIAKLLGLESVPVLLHRRHADWQDVRDVVRKEHVTGTSREWEAAALRELSKNGNANEMNAAVDADSLLDHPDLRDVDTAGDEA